MPATRDRIASLARLVWSFLQDAIIVLAAYAFALLLRFDGHVPEPSTQWLLYASVPIAAAYILSNYWSGVYRAAWKYAGLIDVLTLGRAMGMATLVLFVVDFALPQRHIPLSVVLMGGVLAFVGVTLWRLRGRLNSHLPLMYWGIPARRLLIIGAGNTGQMVAREFLHHREWGYHPVCFVDDDAGKQGVRVHGIPVAGTLADLEHCLQAFQVDMVAIAITVPGRVIRPLISVCQERNIPVRAVLGLPEVLQGKAPPGILRDITVEDLLGREPVTVDVSQCLEYIRGKRILVTGAAGSIGSELVRQLARLQPEQLHLLDTNETGLHNIMLEISATHPTCELRTWVADVGDQARVRYVLEAAVPHLVFHAAAYKHVPMMEQHPREAVRVNVLGTKHVCDLSRELGVEKVVFISTDKAVDPVSVMGATKRVGELLVRSARGSSGTILCGVRFGNVIGSRGSVTETFAGQIDRGGPVTITHPDVTRYFLTIREAVSLVIQAAAFAQQGQAYMLDMGDEIRIVELAEKMIRMRGLRPGEDIPIVFTGLRPGERLREALMSEWEHCSATEHPQILRIDDARTIPAADVHARIQRLSQRLDDDPQELVAALHDLVRCLGTDQPASTDARDQRHREPTEETARGTASA